VPIKAIKKETASLLASLFFFALEVGILRMPANERRSREIGAYTRDLLAQDNIVSKRKVSQKPRVFGGILFHFSRLFFDNLRIEF
jgi:hypothetical protein